MGTVSSRIGVITNLLLGAAYADGTFEGREDSVVRNLLKELLEAKELPAEVDAQIKGFDKKKFDLTAVAKDFASDPPIQRRKLMELAAAVRDADDEIDLDEDEYLHALGVALGMKPSEYSDLTLEIEDLKENFASLRSVPPPAPAKKK